MRIVRTDQFPLPLPEGHRFPAEKYRLLYEAVAEAAGAVFVEAPRAGNDELGCAHTAEYLHKLETGSLSRAEERAIGLPWSVALVERSRRSTGATIAACRAALEDGIAASLAGGTHHAYAERGSGFCVFNDSAVALRLLQRERAIRRALVIDLDVHQGNGTAAILAGDPALYTFSMHGAGNFPFQKEVSDHDVELPDGCGDDAYLDRLAHELPSLFAASWPDLVIYLSGADAYQGDRLGRLALSRAGLAERDAMVLDSCNRYGVPVAVTMGGGYAVPITDTVAIHAATIAAALARAR
ncbi:histone deacetylase family protein [Jeongeupia chitinilytica]|uniref:Histone deacetylase n=1 Tax=Jeongeupia chitinilytica TaxID=1041641 RepID=A0ABQ3GY53_9NEIS|nr:histone deacetylase [Jeongeupia chitinilytica]GHD59291.1 histone deacetylase [Jeongeupia chitinilytica]